MGFAKKKFQKSEITMEVGGKVSLGIFVFVLENRPKIALNQYWYFGVVYHVYSVYTLLKVVGYYDLSVLSSDGFQKKKKLDGGWVGGWGELYPIFLGFLEFFTLQSPITYP